MTFYIFHSTWVFLLLLQCASYESCSASDELIKNFWTVFFELSEENKKRFLGRFCVEHMNILMHLHYLGLSLLFASHYLFFSSFPVWDGPCTCGRFLKALSEDFTVRLFWCRRPTARGPDLFWQINSSQIQRYQHTSWQAYTRYQLLWGFWTNVKFPRGSNPKICLESQICHTDVTQITRVGSKTFCLMLSHYVDL